MQRDRRVVADSLRRRFGEIGHSAGHAASGLLPTKASKLCPFLVVPDLYDLDVRPWLSFGSQHLFRETIPQW
jgi:hypothetical protein